MKCRNILISLCAFALMIVNCTSLTVCAEDVKAPVITTTNDEDLRSEGLILTYSVSITSGSHKVIISAKTTGTDTMAKIGFKDIKIQRSVNGVSGWVDEITLNDQIATDTWYHTMNQYNVSVAGGYCYRVVLTHYAKEQGWFFPSSQSISNVSNVVWVS